MIEVAPLLEYEMNYDGAWLYCATLTYNNKYDWRVPTDAEFTYTEEIDEQSFDESDADRHDLIYLTLKTCPVRTSDN